MGISRTPTWVIKLPSSWKRAKGVDASSHAAPSFLACSASLVISSSGKTISRRLNSWGLRVVFFANDCWKCWCCIVNLVGVGGLGWGWVGVGWLGWGWVYLAFFRL